MIPLPTPIDQSAKTVRIETYPLELSIHPDPPTLATLRLHTLKGRKTLDSLRIENPRGRKPGWVKYRSGERTTTREQTFLLTTLGFNVDETLRGIEHTIADGRPRSVWSKLTLGIRLDSHDKLSDPIITLTTKTSTGTYTLFLVCLNRMNRALTGPSRVQVFSDAKSPAVYWWPQLFNGAHIMHLYRTGDYYSARKRNCHSIQKIFNKIGLNPKPLSALKDDDQAQRTEED